jgi:hypothetical protein
MAAQRWAGVVTSPTWNPMRQSFDPPASLADFLLARIAEDEAAARAVTWHPQARANIRALESADHQRARITHEPRQVFAEDGRVIDWDAYAAALGPVEPITEEGYADLLNSGCGEYYGDDEYNHATRWSPARVLAECEAKRRIVQQCLDLVASFGDWDAAAAAGAGGRNLWPGDVSRRERSHAHAILDAMALPYADHPDFREEWRP